MRHLKISTLLLMAAMWLLPTVVEAQANPMTQQLPVDTAVRVGKLPNGLTYYIRHNEYPKNQADFYIAQKVGSILEEDNQRGLAHFLEHMCFNGTTHFPGSSLRDWLESIGVKFGANLNAYTSIDETVYNISNVPLTRPSIQDSCLLILHDWANDLTLDPKEIDAERGVIHEEWRMNNKGQQRIVEKLLPVMFPDSKYGHRLPIGTMEVVDNFPPQDLRDYYEKWYRPDQQAIVVVGDIDVDNIENTIKTMFADIEMPENAAKREYVQVPDHKGTIYAIGSDPEQNNFVAQLFFLSDPVPREQKNTLLYYVQQYVQNMVATMLNNRLDDLSSKPDAPFAGAFAGYSDYVVAKTKDALVGGFMPKGDNFNEGLAALYRELLRAQRGGFTVTEYDRAKSEYLSNMERAYNNRNTRENGTYVNECVNNFKDGEPMPGIETDYQIAQQLVSMIPLDVINEAMGASITPDNRTIFVLVPEKEGYTVPTQEGIEAVMTAVDAEEIAPHVDQMRTDPLISEMRKPGKVKKTNYLKDWEAEEWVLSNGAKVIVKPTKFKEDEILFSAFANGGTTDLSSDYDKTLIFLSEIGGQNGLGKYTRKDLDKYLAGKQASVRFNIGEYARSGGGSTTPKDLKYLMELIYMSFMDMNYDAEEFKALQNQYVTSLKNQEAEPEFAWQKAMMETLYKGNARRELITSEIVEEASFDKTNEIVKQQMANAADFTFVFVGNINKGELKKYVEQYIASLPGDAKTAVKGKVARKDRDMLPLGTKTTTVQTKMKTPTTYVAIIESADVPYNMKNAQMMSIFGQILTARLVKSIREEKGAVYSIGASPVASDNDKRNFVLQIPFPMKPEQKQEVLDAIHAEINAMGDNVTLEELAPMREYMVKNAKDRREKNGGVLGGIVGFVQTGQDTFNRNIDSLNSITVDDMKKFIQDFNAQNNYQVIILEAEEETK